MSYQTAGAIQLKVRVSAVAKTVMQPANNAATLPAGLAYEAEK